MASGCELDCLVLSLRMRAAFISFIENAASSSWMSFHAPRPLHLSISTNSASMQPCSNFRTMYTGRGKAIDFNTSLRPLPVSICESFVATCKFDLNPPPAELSNIEHAKGNTTRAWQQAKAKHTLWMIMDSWIQYVSKAPEPKRANWQTIKKKMWNFRRPIGPPQELGSPPSQASETAPRPCWGHFEGRLAARAWRSDPSLTRTKSHYDKLNLLIDICMYLHHVNS